MSVPLRKDEFVEENLTTADLAKGKRPAAVDDRLTSEDRLDQERPRADVHPADRTTGDPMSTDRPGPVLAERAVDQPAQRPASEGLRNSASRNAEETAPLFPGNELEELRNRWNSVQTAFVDEPRRAVEQADALVASAMKRLAEVFAEERTKLEQHWDRGDNVSTEDLRVALQRYRSFFQRLLSI
jgi:hypothetical protein